MSTIEKLLMDIFKAHQRSQKSLAHKEPVFANMLTDVYKKFVNDKQPESVNLLESALKYCQQNRATEKVKQQTKQSLSPPIQKSSPLPVPTSVSQLCY